MNHEQWLKCSSKEPISNAIKQHLNKKKKNQWDSSLYMVIATFQHVNNKADELWYFTHCSTVEFKLLQKTKMKREIDLHLNRWISPQCF